MEWTVYVLVSRKNGTTYVGITTDVPRRLRQHNGESGGGARATRTARPWRIGRKIGPFPTRGDAQRVEYAVKQLRGARRLRWNEEGSG